MSLNKTLSKLTAEDKMIILKNLIILPMIEQDSLLSKEEFSNILTAGTKMGFAKSIIIKQIHKQTKELGATLE